MQVNHRLEYKKSVKQLKKLGEEGHKAIDKVIASNVLEMVGRAKTLAPKDSGFLFKSINFKKVKPAYYQFYVNAPYAAYQEFGTGNLVNVPKELQKLAIQYKGKGIRQVNMRPQPFFYPSVVAQRPQLIKDMNDAFKKLSNG